MKKRLLSVFVMVAIVVSLFCVMAISANAIKPFIEIQIVDCEKTYDGTADLPDSSYEIVAGELMGEDELKISYLVEDIYSTSTAFTFSNLKIMRGSQDVTGMYDLSFTSTEAILTQKPIEIEITAGSDSKAYDGQALTCDSYDITDGEFATGDELVANDVAMTSNSTVTEISDSPVANKIDVSTLKVMHDAKDVTALYNFTPVDGTLTVTKIPITVTPDNFEKTYDGTDDLVGANCKVTSGKLILGDELHATLAVDNIYAKKTTIRVHSYVVLRDDVDVTYLYDVKTETGTLTQNPVTIGITAGSDFKVFDGTPLTYSNYSITSGTFITGDVLDSANVGTTESSTITHVKDSPVANKIDKTTLKVMHGDIDVTELYKFETVDGQLSILQKDVTLTSSDATATYNGKRFTCTEVTPVGFLDGDGASYAFSGKQVNVGTSSNTFVYNGFYSKRDVASLESDYNFIYQFGTLEVTPALVTVTSDSDTKMYDGSELIKHSFTVTEGEFAEGEGIDATYTGTITNVGTNKNTFTYEFKDGTLSTNYIITTVEGDLTVTVRNVTITSGSSSRMYDGTALTNDNTEVSGDGFASGEGYVANVTGSQLNFGTSDNIFTYQLNNGTLETNYNITTEYGTLEITRRSVTITSGSATKMYDGSALVNGSTEITDGDGFASGEGYTADVTGSQKDAGTSDNTFTYTLNEGTLADNYDITTVYGTLEVTKCDAIIISNDAQKMYDGTALTDNGFMSMGFVAGEGVDVTFTGSQLNYGSSFATFTYVALPGTNLNNYNIITDCGTLDITKRSITITSDGDTKCYDGTPLTDDSFTVGGDGFVAGEGVTLQYTGSQTEIGSSPSTFSYDFNQGTLADNYEVTTYEGTLTVRKRTVYITSLDATKTYDGVELSRNEYVITGDGFMSGDGITATYTGVRLNVGKSDNKFTYELIAGTNPDVYEISYKFGTLEVTKRSVIIKTGSATKVYDGNALCEKSYTFEGDGFVDGELKNLELTLNTEITNVGTKKNLINGILLQLNEGYSDENYSISVEFGTLEVTKRPITITTGSASRIYDGTPLKCSDAKVEGTTVEGEKIRCMFINSQTNVGTCKNDLQITYTDGALEGNYDVVVIPGDLTVEKRPVTIISVSDSKVYDGKPLIAMNYMVKGEGFVGEEGIIAEFTNSQTNVGSCKNAFTYLPNTVTTLSNYDITIEFGDLVVEKRDAKIISLDGSKVYDGTAITNNGFETSGFVDGQGVDVVFTGSQTNAGSSKSTFTYSAKAGTDLRNYNIQTVDGTLIVEKRNATITSFDGTKVYDGTALTSKEYKTSGFVDGQGVDVTFLGSQTNAGKSKNTFNYSEIAGTDFNNYNIHVVEGTLSVEKRDATITSLDASKMYDGTALTNNEFKTSGFVDGQGVDVTFTGSQLNAGNSKNTFKCSAKAGTNLNNYNIHKVEGTLTVTKRDVTIKSSGSSRSYDGTPLTSKVGLILGSEFVDGEGVDIDYTGSQLNVGTSRNTFTYKLKSNTNADNYDITCIEGDLKVIKRNVTITSDSAAKDYDKTPLTANNCTITGQGFVEGQGVTITYYGTQTEIGTSKNDFSLVANEGTDLGNYNLTLEKGDLTVDPRFVKVTFNTIGGDSINPTSVLAYETMSEPDAATRKDYHFMGWYADEDLNTLFDFDNTIIENDVTLFASWVLEKDYNNFVKLVEDKVAKLEKLRTENDSELVKKLITDGKKSINGIIYDIKAVYADNKEVVDTIANEIIRKVNVQRKLEKFDVERPYLDVTVDDYFFNSIAWAYSNDYVNGVDETTFDSFGTTTRGQMLTILWRMAGCPEVEEGFNTKFVDVDANKYYYKAIIWAESTKITNGTSENTFSPDDYVTREQVVLFLYRYIDAKPIFDMTPSGPATVLPFTDVENTDYSYNAIKYMYVHGYINGTTATTFEPDALCNRCDLVVILYRMFAK